MCRRAPQESQSWRSSNASPDLQPRHHGDASGRRRKSAPEFRVAESEEGHNGTGRDSSSGRNTEREGETTEKREKERNGEPDLGEETERSVNPGYPGREREERTEEPPREETEDATACHGPGGSWLDKLAEEHLNVLAPNCGLSIITVCLDNAVRGGALRVVCWDGIH
ncbi:hypothetical protein NDU88_002165 [Pleurodeles waltl]|uniref:Uncharacterized protein n=1 Tax=Pleurodeles waltl TaxID=8319 RepID=A0AAV7MMZ6_PLEWA|nr:hypothetical protein NDU88_002165 [Pleurodeles waltl]